MDDLISRQAAIKAICEDGTWLESQGCTEITMAERKQRDADILGELPSVQQDTSTDTQTTTYGFGKWIEKEDDGYRGGGYTECSVCGQRYSWGGYFEANEFRYCPRCGHRMEVQEDGGFDR